MRFGNKKMLRFDTTVEFSGAERMDGIQITFRTQQAKWIPWCYTQDGLAKEGKINAMEIQKWRKVSHADLHVPTATK